jgi:hypothetical protein
MFVLTLNFFIYKRITNGKINKTHWTLLGIFSLFVIALNNSIASVSPKLILFLILFSLSIMLLSFFISFVKVFERSNLIDAKKTTRAKFLMVNVIMPAMITIFQILIIWINKFFDEMNQ